VINGSPYNGPIDEFSIRAIIKLQELQEIQFAECPPMIIDPLKQYIATIQTEKGEIIVELYPDVAPLAVNSFIFLAENNWFNGVTFHRVLPGFIAQAGDPTETGLGGPGYAFKNEITPDLVFDRGGQLAMANAGPDSNGSQFFITYGPAEHLNGGYTIFGTVIQGMDVVESLTPRNPSDGIDLPPGDKIITISIEEN
jgi:cyclophilin family peptidyl-prolyl cis-trans isomerase